MSIGHTTGLPPFFPALNIQPATLVPLQPAQFQLGPHGDCLVAKRMPMFKYPSQEFRDLAASLGNAPFHSDALDLVVNPCSAVDLAALVLFPNASRYLFLDKLYHFPPSVSADATHFYPEIVFGRFWEGEKMKAYAQDFGLIPLFMGALSLYLPQIRPLQMLSFTVSGDAPHFYMRFDRGEGTKEQEVFYVTANLRDFRGNEFWLNIIDEASYPALLVKSAMSVLSGSPFAYSTSDAKAFRRYLQARLEQGRSLLLTGLEEFSGSHWEFASKGFFLLGKDAIPRDEAHLYQCFPIWFGYSDIVGAFLHHPHL